MGRTNYSYSSLLSSVVKDLYYRYTEYERNEDTLADRVSEDAQASTRRDYSLYQFLQEEYNVDALRLQTLQLIPPNITLIGRSPQLVLRNTQYIDPGITVDIEEYIYTVDTSNINMNVVGSYDLIYKVEDYFGNTSIAKRVVRVKETLDPEIILNGENPYFLEKYSSYVDPGAIVDTGHSYSVDYSSVDQYTEGTYTVTYSVDFNGRVITSTRSVIVVDRNPPTVTLSGENPQIIDRFTSYTENGVVVDIGSSITSIDTSNVNLNEVGNYDVVYTAYDGTNYATITRVVTVVDNIPPVATLNGPNPYTVDRFSIYQDPGVTLDAGSVLTYTDTSNVNMNVLGEYDVIYRIDDGSNTIFKSRTVTVIDVTPPNITLNGENPYYVERFSDYQDPGISLDLGSNLISTDTSNVNTSTYGDYDVIYKAIDESNNIAHGVRVVKVVDTLAPVITLNGDNPFTLERATEYIDPGVVLDQGTSLVSTDTSNINVNVIGNYDVVYKAYDGNSITHSIRTVSVVDTKPPVITLNGSNPYIVEKFSNYQDPGVTLDTGSTLISADISNVNTDVEGFYNVVYKGYDGYNVTHTVRTVSVVDRTPPNISLLGSNPYIINKNIIYSDPGITLDTDSKLISTDTSNVNTSTPGDYDVIYVANDGTNTIISKRVVRVQDVGGPTITIQGFNPYTIERGESYYEFGALVEDNEELTIDTTELNANVAGVYNVYYRSTKNSNTSTITRKVIIQDTNAPVITLLGKNPDYCNLNAKYIDPGAISDTSEAVKSDSSTSVNSSIEGIYTVKYVTVDISGNSSFKTRNVIVDVFPQPTLTLLGDNPQVLELGEMFVDSGVRSTENEIITNNSSNVININKTGEYEITYIATNSYGQTATISRIVKIVDTKAPLIYSAGYYKCIRARKNLPLVDPGGYSNDGTVIVADRSQVNVLETGIQKIVYTTKDGSDNTYTIDRPVLVTDSLYAYGRFGNKTLRNSFINLETLYGVGSLDQHWRNKIKTRVSDDGSRLLVAHYFYPRGFFAIYDYDYTTNEWLLNTVNYANYAGGATTDRFENNLDMSRDGSVLAINAGYYDQLLVMYTISSNGIQQLGNVIDLQNLNNNTNFSVDLINGDLKISGDGQRVAIKVRYRDSDTANVGTRLMIFHYNQQTNNWDMEFNEYLVSYYYSYFTINADMTVIFKFGDTDYTRSVFRLINNSWTNVTNTEIDVPQPVPSLISYIISNLYRHIEAFSDDGSRFMKLNAPDESSVGIFEYSPSTTSWTQIGNYVNVAGYKSLSGDGSMFINCVDKERIDVYKLYNNEWVVNDSIYPSSPEVSKYFAWSNIADQKITSSNNGKIMIGVARYESSTSLCEVYSGGKNVYIEGQKSIAMKRGTNFIDPGGVVSLVNDTVVTVTDFINANVNGIYTLIYHNASSEDDFIERELVVEDGPGIFLHGPNPYYVNTSNEYIDPGYYSSGGEIVSVFSSNVIPNTPGSYLVGYSATNSNNITNEITRRVVVEQYSVSSVPVITLYGDNPMFVELNSVYTDPGATSSDGASIQVNLNNVDTSNVGTYNVSYTIDTGVFKTRSVVVTNGPKIVLLGDNPHRIKLNNDYVEPYAYCVGGENVEIDSSNVNVNEEGTYSVIYKSIDDNQNETITVRDVIVKDEPKINLIGGSEIQIESKYIEPGVVLNGKSNYDIVRDESNVNTNLKNSTFICNYVYTGVENNTYKNTRAVHVKPDPSTVITSQISLYGDNPQIVKRDTMYVDPGAVSSGSETIVFNRQTLDMNTNGEYSVTYSITDSNFNRVTKVRRVIVEDPDPPIINLIGDDPLYVTRSDTQSYTDPGASSSGGEIVYTFSNNVNISKYGEYSVFYSCSNVITGLVSTTKRGVIVQDLQSPPTIELIGDSTINLKYPQSYTEYGIITQNPSNLSYTYSNSNPIDINTPGTYTVTYNVATDDARSNTISRSVVVSNDQLPDVTLIGENPQKIQVGTPYEELGAKTDGNLAILIDSSDVNTNLIGSYEVVYTSGNTNVTRTVVVQDKIAPIITPIGDNPLYIKRGSITAYTDLGATSDGGEDVTIISNNVDVEKVGTYKVEYVAADSNGNVGRITRTVNIRNDNKPVGKLNGGDISRVTYGTVYNDPGITSDNADDVVEYFEDRTLLSGRGGVNTFYRVTDKNDNKVDITRTLLIQDNFLQDSSIELLDTAYSPLGWVSKLSSMSDDGDIVVLQEGLKYERQHFILKRNSDSTWVDITGRTADDNPYSLVCVISGDGRRVLICYYYVLSIYDYEDDEWVIKFTCDHTVFGESTQYFRDYDGDLKLSKDGNFIALGGYSKVRVYRIENNSGVFSLSQIGNDIVGVNSGDLIRPIIDISHNGQIIALSEHGYDNENGSVRVFEYLPYVNEWFLLGRRIKGENQFGCGLALSSDGTIVAIGSNTYFEVYKFSENGEWRLMGDRIYKGLYPSYRGNLQGPKTYNRLFMSGDGLTLGIGNQGIIYKFYSNNWVEIYSGLDTGTLSQNNEDPSQGLTMGFSYNGELLGTLLSAQAFGSSQYYYMFKSFKTYGVSPILTLTGDDVHYVNQYEEYKDPGFKKGGDGEIVNILSDNYDPNKRGLQYVKYGIVSERGIVSSKLRNVFTVSQAPIITLKGSNPFYIKRHSFYVDPGAEISENDGFLIVDYSDVDTSITGSYNVKYTSYNIDSKKRVVYRHVIVEENDNPSKIFIIGPNPYNIKYGDEYQEFSAVSDTGEEVTIDTTNLNLNNPGKYYVTYSITNKNTGIINYVRRDVNIFLPTGFQSYRFIGSNPVVIKLGDSYIERGLSLESGETLLIDNSSINTNVIGKYQVEYYVVNSTRIVSNTINNGIEKVYKDVFVLEEPETPVITLNNSKNISVFKGTPYIEYGARVTSDQDITIDSAEVDTDKIGIYKVYYSVLDSTNRTIQVHRNVMVVLNTAAIITPNPGISTYLLGGTYIEAGYTSTVDVNIKTNAIDFTKFGSYPVYYVPKESSILADITYNTSRSITVFPHNSFFGVGGYSGRFTSDNSKIFVGSQYYTDTVLYEKISGGIWELKSRFSPSWFPGDRWNHMIAMNGDGTRVAYYSKEVSQTTEVPGTTTYNIYIDEYSASTNTWQHMTSYPHSYRVESIDLSEDGDTFFRVFNPRTGNYRPIESEAKVQSYVYIYKYVNGVWVQDSTITVDDDIFDACLTRDGTTIALHMRYMQIRVWDYNSTSSTWVERAGSFNIPNARYGWGGRVYMSDDGNRIVTGSLNASILDYDYSTNSWTAIKNFTTIYGWQVQISGDGNVVALGSYTFVDVYKYSQATGDWTLIFKHEHPGTEGFALTGLSKDGTHFYAGGQQTVLGTIKCQNYIYNIGNHIKILGNNPYYMREGDTYNDPGANYIEFETGFTSSNVTVDTSNLDANTNGTYTIQYSYLSNGSTLTETRIVKVLQEIPIITLNGSNPYYLEKGSNYTDPGYVVGEDITVTVDQGNLDVNKSGTYTIKYTASDVMGGYGYATRSVVVQKTTTTIITLIGSNPQNVTQGLYHEYGVTVNDDETRVYLNSNVDHTTNGTYTVSYTTFSDDGQQSNTISRDVIVSNKTIQLLGSNPYYITAWQQLYTDPGVRFNNEPIGVGKITVDASNVNLYKNGTYTVKYSNVYFYGTHTYAMYNEREVIVNIPRITTLIGEDPYYVDMNSTYVDPGVTTEIGQVQIDISNLDMNTFGTYKVFYNVLDSNNNIINGTCRTVITSRAPVPVLNGFNPLLVKRGDEYTEFGAFVPSGDQAQIKFNNVNTSVNGTYTVDYVYTYYNGATANVSREVIVSDNLSVQVGQIPNNGTIGFSVYALAVSGNGLRLAMNDVRTNSSVYLAPVVYDLKGNSWEKVYDFSSAYGDVRAFTATKTLFSEDGNRIALSMYNSRVYNILEIYDWDDFNKTWILNFTFNVNNSASTASFYFDMSGDGKTVCVYNNIFRNIQGNEWVRMTGNYPNSSRIRISHYGDKMLFCEEYGDVSIYKFNGAIGIEKMNELEDFNSRNGAISGDGRVVVLVSTSNPPTIQTYKFDNDYNFYQIGQTFAMSDYSWTQNKEQLQLSYYGDILIFGDGGARHMYKYIDREDTWSLIKTYNNFGTPSGGSKTISINMNNNLITYFEINASLRTDQIIL